VADNNNTYSYLGLHVKCPICLPYFNRILVFATYFHMSPQYEILRKSVQWEPRWHTQTDAYDECNRRFTTNVIGAFRSYANVPQTETKIRENMTLNSDLYCITSVFLIRAAPPGLRDRQQIIWKYGEFQVFWLGNNKLKYIRNQIASILNSGNCYYHLVPTTSLQG